MMGLRQRIKKESYGLMLAAIGILGFGISLSLFARTFTMDKLCILAPFLMSFGCAVAYIVSSLDLRSILKESLGGEEK